MLSARSWDRQGSISGNSGSDKRSPPFFHSIPYQAIRCQVGPHHRICFTYNDVGHLCDLKILWRYEPLSMPTFSDQPPISRDDAINQIISSIALEELGLSHIINAEGEKIQYALGTIPGQESPEATIQEILEVNDSVRDMLQQTSVNQILLQTKLKTAVESDVLVGPVGPTGPTGPTGDTGPTGPAVGADSMGALNTSSTALVVLLGGTTVPLPNDQSLGTFTVDGADEVFTVQTTGRYLISYEIKTTLALLMSSRLLLNGAPMPGSVIAPALSVSSYSNTLIADLNANDTLELQLFGVAGAAVLQSGTGASLTAVRLN